MVEENNVYMCDRARWGVWCLCDSVQICGIGKSVHILCAQICICMAFVPYMGMCMCGVCTHRMCMDILAVCTCMYVALVCMAALADQWHSKMARRDHPIASDG